MTDTDDIVGTKPEDEEKWTGFRLVMVGFAALMFGIVAIYTAASIIGE